MKMQNIVRSPRERAGIVTKFNKQAGSTLVTDEVIMEFGKET
jgi:biotin carboxyl carrier protein